MLRYFDEHPELLDGIEPEHDLWPGIESRIEARVLPLAAKPRVEVHTTRRRFTWLPTVAAAAALVVTTAGITYVLTRRSVELTGAAPAVATTRATAPAADTQGSSAITTPAPEASGTVASNDSAPGSNRDDTPRTVATPKSPAHFASRAEPSERDEMRSDYDREITTLRAALDARRTQLDPATVATVEQNLHVIDNAIRQAREALAKDPKSRFLNDQLDRTLAKKTELLRAAALLPAT
jgi:hypothetical protein